MMPVPVVQNIFSFLKEMTIRERKDQITQSLVGEYVCKIGDGAGQRYTFFKKNEPQFQDGGLLGLKQVVPDSDKPPRTLDFHFDFELLELYFAS